MQGFPTLLFMRKVFLLQLLCALLCAGTHAQPGGQTSYSYLQVMPSARLGALGGTGITIKDQDPTTGFYNPALLNPLMHGILSLNYVNYLSDASYGVSGYAFATHGGTGAVSLQYNNYGKFVLTDNTSSVKGSFSAADYKLQAGYSKVINPQFTLGANYSLLYSAYESYSSLGMALDAGAHFHSIDNSFQSSLLVKNLGTQLTSFVPGGREKLPLLIQGAASYKLAHVPLRFTCMLNNLQRWNLVYRDSLAAPQKDPLTGQIQAEKSLFAPNLVRHLAFGVEFLVSQAVHLRLGYNIQRQQELMGSSRPGLAGFSGGVGINLSRFYFSYAIGKYHFYGNSHFLSLGFYPSSFGKKASDKK
jgi:hypothetical protein